MNNLEPFNLKFPIYCGTGTKGYYFISNPYNYNTKTNSETVDLSQWSVDDVIDVYIQEKIYYKNEKRLYKTPKNSIHLRYEFNKKASKLLIFWGNYLLDVEAELVIKFYSLSQQREKTLNQLFNDES